MGDSYESFYTGGYSSLNPEFGNYMGIRLPASQFASTTSIQSPNQLNEVVSRIKEGVKNVELQPINPDTFDQIPKQHFKEMRALMKLTGVKASIHAPVSGMSAAGFGQQGYDETTRKQTEKRFLSVIERAHELDPKGNIPVVIHSTEGIPGNEYAPGKEGEPRFKEEKVLIVDQETGQLKTLLKEEKTHYWHKPEDFGEGGTLKKVWGEHGEKRVAELNQTQWDQQLTNLAFYEKEANEMWKSFTDIKRNPDVLEISNTNSPEKLMELERRNPEIFHQLSQANLFLENNEQTFLGLFDKAYKYGTSEQKKILKNVAKDWTEKEKDRRRKYIQEGNINPLIKFHEDNASLNEKIATLSKVTSREFAHAHGKTFAAPTTFKPVEEFAREKSAKTFGNLAWDSYQKFGENSPIIAVENMYMGMPFGKPEDFKQQIKDSRKVFVKNAEEKGMSKGDAKKKAEKFLGVTWDVGHVNLMKKSGFKDSDIVEATKKLAPYVKHIHLTDNFGHGDSHLAPGMGNVPTKKILEELEKAGKLKDTRAVLEAGALVMPQGLGMSPHKWAMEAFGSPTFGGAGAPYWNQAMGATGGYFSGYGDMNPSTHHSIYGAGFTSLPKDLGGNIPGTGSRFSGTPNA